MVCILMTLQQVKLDSLQTQGCNGEFKATLQLGSKVLAQIKKEIKTWVRHTTMKNTNPSMKVKLKNRYMILLKNQSLKGARSFKEDLKLLMCLFLVKALVQT